jgi:hypothetical protein
MDPPATPRDILFSPLRQNNCGSKDWLHSFNHGGQSHFFLLLLLLLAMTMINHGNQSLSNDGDHFIAHKGFWR